MDVLKRARTCIRTNEAHESSDNMRMRRKRNEFLTVNRYNSESVACPPKQR